MNETRYVYGLDIPDLAGTRFIADYVFVDGSDAQDAADEIWVEKEIDSAKVIRFRVVESEKPDLRPPRPRMLRITFEEETKKVIISDEESERVFARWSQLDFDVSRDPHGLLRRRIDNLFIEEEE
jgi:hypothetical protein